MTNKALSERSAPSADGASASLPRFGEPGAAARWDLLVLGQTVRVRQAYGEDWQIAKVCSKMTQRSRLLGADPASPGQAWHCTESVPAGWELRDISEKNAADVKEERDIIAFKSGDLNNNDSYGTQYSTADLVSVETRIAGLEVDMQEKLDMVSQAAGPLQNRKEQETALEKIMAALDAAKEQAKTISAALSQGGRTTQPGESPAQEAPQAAVSRTATVAPVSELAERRMDDTIGREATYWEMVDFYRKHVIKTQQKELSVEENLQY